MEWGKTGPRFRPQKSELPGPGEAVRACLRGPRCCCFLRCQHMPASTDAVRRRLLQANARRDP
jgi:hypothetical protein